MQMEVTQYGRLSFYVFDIALLVFFTLSIRAIRQQACSWTRQSLTRRVALSAIAVLTGGSLLSVFWSLESHVAVFAAVHMLLAAGLFAVLVLDKEISPDFVLTGFVAGMLVPSVLGWMQSAQQFIGASTLLGIASQDPLILGTSVIEHAQGRWLRAYGSFPHPNIFGGFLAFGLVAVMGVVGRAKWSVSNAVLWLAAVLMGGALVMSASRGAWLAAFLGVGVLLVGLGVTKQRLVLRRIQKPLLLTLMVILIVSASLGSILVTRFDVSNRLETQSVTERVDQWRDVKDLSLQSARSFFFGTGIGNTVFALEEMRPLRRAWVYQPVHNFFGLVFVELGILGLLIVLGLIATTDWLTHRHWNQLSAVLSLALGGVVFVLACTDHYLWTQPSGLYLLAIFLALKLRLGEAAALTEHGNK